MRFFGIIIKYLLRSLFSIIAFLLLVGLSKTHWDINAYITFLNANDRSLFHWSQIATWSDPFWPQNAVDTSIDEELSDEALESEMSGLDVYDPDFEKDITTVTADEEDFGFVADWQITWAQTTWSTSTLRDLIKQHELPQ